jgi:hypothetical protein
MAVPRAYHTATLLDDGRLLVAGDIIDPIASVEIYRPDAGPWSAAASMKLGRYEHSATRLLDGRVLVAGGRSPEDASPDNTVVNGAELYDPASAAWSHAGPLNDPRAWHVATLLDDGAVLVTGGIDPSAAIPSAESYDPVADAWTLVGPMTVARAFHAATLLPDGRVLVTGGASSWALDGKLSAELYDPKIRAFASVGPMTAPRAMHTATLLQSGEVLITGGLSDVVQESTELYDPKTGSFRPAAPLAAPRALHTATLLGNGKVLVVGGLDLSMHSSRSAELYDPATNTWETVAPLDVPRTYHTATLLADGRVLVAGGNISPTNAVQASAELYTPATGTLCASAADCPSGFCAGGVCCDRACDGVCEVCSVAAGAAWNGTCAELDQAPGGACLRGCRSAYDCHAPLACDPSGHCAAPPPDASDDSRCSASARAPRASRWLGPAGVLAAIAAALGRRRSRRSTRPSPP